MRGIRLLLIVMISISLAACAGVANGGSPVANGGSPDQPVSNQPGDRTPEPTAPTEERYAPRPGDEQMLEGNVYIDSMELLTLESFPPQFRLHITGSTPTPCHQLRVAVEEPNDVGKILVKIYSVSDPQAICIQVLAPFDISIPINVGVAGTFTVIANGQDLGTIEVPEAN